MAANWLWLEGTTLHAVFREQLLAQFCPLSDPDVVVEMGEDMGSFWISIAWPTHSSSVPIYPFNFLEMKQTGLPWLPSRLSFPSAQVEPTSKGKVEMLKWAVIGKPHTCSAISFLLHDLKTQSQTYQTVYVTLSMTHSCITFVWLGDTNIYKAMLEFQGVQHPQLTDIHSPSHQSHS